MTDFDLESKLKGIPVPERPPEYWENFPAQVRSQIRGAGFLPARPAGSLTRHFRLPRLAWGVSVALACAIFCLTAWPAFHAALLGGRTFQRELAQLPVHLRVLMQDEHGMHYLIADQP